MYILNCEIFEDIGEGLDILAKHKKNSFLCCPKYNYLIMNKNLLKKHTNLGL